MPLRWKRGTNPYADNAFSVLQVGSFATPGYIIASANNLVAADRHPIDQAARLLRDPATRAEEQLLAHPQVRRDTKRPQRLARDIDAAAVLPAQAATPALRGTASIFWFTPAPGADVAPLPAWDALGLAAIGTHDDLALDIVFDV